MSHNQVDVAFVVDTTGSMGGFIEDAKRRMLGVLQALIKTANIDIRVVLVDYRDHPPQENTYASNLQTGVHPVDLKQFERALKGLGLGGGGDTPESVLDGLAELKKVKWREHSRRIAFLVGDAAGHGGYGRLAGDHWPTGCPCGKTIESVSADLESSGILLYGICVSGDESTKSYFRSVARFTGGEMISGNGVTEVERLLKKEFGQLDLDKTVLDEIQKDPINWSITSLVTALNLPSGDVDSSVRRLIGRDLVTEPRASA
jgi:hypothetical protein